MKCTARWLTPMAIIAVFLAFAAARAETVTATIAVHVSLSGPSELGGKALLDAVRFAVEEANTAGSSPAFELAVFDDRSDKNRARERARDVKTGDALAVVGPATSVLALAACPVYADTGLAVIDATFHAADLALADDRPEGGGIFRDFVEAIANYLGRVLGETHATVIYKDNGYGRPLVARFKSTAERLVIAGMYRPFDTAAQRDEVAKLTASDPDQPPVVLGMTYEDAAPVLLTLRRQGYRGLVFGTATMARASFVDLFADQPEERRAPGFFTEGVYAASPMILDSANAATLAFAARYRARFGQEASWETTQGYDAARLAMAAVRATYGSAEGGRADLVTRRKLVHAYLASLDSPAKAAIGLTGPLWFTPDRIRPQAVRIGRFHGGLFESAPLQIVPVVATPTLPRSLRRRYSNWRPGATHDCNALCTPACSSMRLPVWSWHDRVSTPIFIFGSVTPAMPGRTARIRPTSTFRT